MDIGTRKGLDRSIYHDMERAETSGYWNYFRDQQP